MFLLLAHYAEILLQVLIPDLFSFLGMDFLGLVIHLYYNNMGMKYILPLCLLSVSLGRVTKERPTLQKQQPCKARGVFVSYEDEFDDVEKKVKDPHMMSVEEVEMRIRKKGSVTLGMVDVAESLNNVSNPLYNMTYSPPRLNYK